MIAILLLCLIGLSGCQNTSSPTWAQSPYFQAGSSSLITTTTSAPFTNSYNIPFSPVTATDPPYLAIGLKSYTGTQHQTQVPTSSSRNTSTSRCYLVPVRE